MSTEQETEVSKKPEKPKKVMLKNQIERYLRIPFFLLIPLVIFNGFIYIANVETGIFFTIGLIAYALIVTFIYVHNKPNIMSSLISFAFEQGQVQKELLKDLAIPYALIDLDGRILWANPLFYGIIGTDKPSKKSVTQLFPEITKELFPQKNNMTEFDMRYEDGYYRVELRRVVVNDILPEEVEVEKEDGLIAMYLFDETELRRYIQENKDQKLVAGLIYIDNYEEALEGVEDVRRPLLTALIDRKINKYMQNIDAIVKKLEKDKFLVVFQQKYLQQLQAAKFALLDEVRAINIGNEIAVTLSIGLGVNAPSYLQAYDAARMAIDLALGRGGDQAVLKDGEQIYYYGGKSQGVEKNTRVKARVKAHALREVLETKDQVIIMGHKMPDVDSLGAAIGIYRLAATMERRAHIVINDVTVSIRPVMNNFIGNNLYPEDLFIDSEQAKNLVDQNTALIVVDVNRASYTECEELLNMTKSIVVIDHHRAMSDSIQNAILSYIEPYASSACEMVAEILQYIIDKPKLRPIEADAMYSGILVDTDTFVTKTGVRTFEAASFLKRSGADVTRVRKMFRTEMEVYKQKAAGVENAEIFLDDYAIGILPSEGVDSPTVLAAQIANELLDIDGVKASFMLTQIKDTIYISARSIDEVNVQVIMERMGGGGHATVAGAQLHDCTLEEGKLQLQDVLEKMTVEGDI
ncbi:MAG: DHH family phosphoesterase [Lachnospiraceae bacterium]|nr:DHH family phosphoesterase [Lachnospiraceae bacterium]